ncbi:MAG TPA: DUF4357 domain-containing protein [Succinivibrionaceae bacterium]|nr:DUF4357 domain-containing protein [Succinivibrionaceae bacterium]
MSTQTIYFLTDDQGNKTHAVLPIELYESLLGLKDMVNCSASLSQHEIYTFRIKNVIAQGYPTGPRSHPAFVIIKGSQITLQTVGSVPKHITEFRDKLLDEEKLRFDAQSGCLTTCTDLVLKSSSMAATLVAGNVRNGLDVWINREGFSLKDSGYGAKARRNHNKKDK